jgi:hypothetical protein
MRQFNKKYQDRNWAMIAGLLDNKPVSLSFAGKVIQNVKTYPGELAKPKLSAPIY